MGRRQIRINDAISVKRWSDSNMRSIAQVYGVTENGWPIIKEDGKLRPLDPIHHDVHLAGSFEPVRFGPFVWSYRFVPLDNVTTQFPSYQGKSDSFTVQPSSG